MKKRDLDNIVLFKEIVDAGSLSSAANNLDISVAQVSNMLVALEKSLKLTLLQRTTRSICMTAAGELLYAKSCLISQELDNTWEDLASLQDIPQGMLRIGAH